MSVKKDIENNILACYALIKAHEETLRLSDSPREKARARRDIEWQWSLVKRHLLDYFTLCTRLNQPPAPDIAELAVMAGSALPPETIASSDSGTT